MVIAILGSGFGLYGYLPALAMIDGVNVVLPERYAVRLDSRKDVRHLSDRVVWAADEYAALDRADALVITQRPDDQARWVDEVLRRPRIGTVLLEKPVAADPDRAAEVMLRLTRAGRRFTIGYTLRYTSWGQGFIAAVSLADAAAPAQQVDIAWCFRAHHYATGSLTWKRKVSSGGGALRFYGVHLIALLAEAGYTEAVSSTTTALESDEAERWDAVFAGPGRPTCRVSVDSEAERCVFSLLSASGVRTTLADPFDDVERHGSFDRRVGITAHLCRDLLDPNLPTHSWYAGAIALWQATEAGNRIVPRRAFPQ